MVGEIKLREFVKEVVEKFPNDKMITEEQVQEIIAYVEENSPRYSRGEHAGEPQVFADYSVRPDAGHVFPNGSVARNTLYVVFFYRKGRMTDGESWDVLLPNEVA